MIALCLLPKIRGYKSLGEPKSCVEYDQAHLLGLIEKNIPPLNTMMERAAMSEMDIYNRTRDISLLQLPVRRTADVGAVLHLRG